MWNKPSWGIVNQIHQLLSFLNRLFLPEDPNWKMKLGETDKTVGETVADVTRGTGVPGHPTIFLGIVQKILNFFFLYIRAHLDKKYVPLTIMYSYFFILESIGLKKNTLNKSWPTKSKPVNLISRWKIFNLFSYSWPPNAPAWLPLCFANCRPDCFCQLPIRKVK